MNIFRRFLLGGNTSEKTEVSTAEESSNSLASSEAGSSSMHQPESGDGTPQSSQQDRSNSISKCDCSIEIPSSEDERVAFSVHDKEGREKLERKSNITRVSKPGISKMPTEDVTVRLSAAPTAVAGSKATSSPLEVTATDTSNDFDDDGDEGKENSAAVSRIDNTTSITVTSKAESETSSPAKIANATRDISRPNESPVESVTKTTDKVFSSIKRRRKRARNSQAVLSTALLSSSSFHGKAIRQQRRKDPPQDSSSNAPMRSVINTSNSFTEENSFAFLSDAHDKKKHQETTQERESPPKNNLLENRTSTNSKRSHADAFKETTSLPNKKQNIQQDSQFENEVDSGNRRSKIEYEKKGQNPFQSTETSTELLSKAVPQFKLPAELAPFNNPGVCDYGVIRTSRLRNRKKTNGRDDVLYQNIQGQRRCRATKDGKKMNGQGNTNRCLNCAEGVFKYCHTHRNLDDDQKFYWEQRERRESQMGSASSSVRTNMATKGLSVKLKPDIKLEIKPIARSSWIPPHLARMTCTEVPGSVFENNNPRRCVSLVQGKGRCNRKILLTDPGFCYGHSSLAGLLKKPKDEFFRGHDGTMRCTAVSKVGSKCKFKALDQCVFCSRHIRAPPEKASAIQYVSLEKVKGEAVGSIANAESRGGSTKKMIQNKSWAMGNVSTVGMQSSISKQSKSKISKLNGRKDLSSNIIGKAKSSSVAGSDAVPKNIEFPRTIQFSKVQIEKATSFDNMCFNVYRSKRCWYKRAEGSILCYKCLVCHEEGTAFDHILRNDAQGDESILFSSQCVRFEKGKQCDRMALSGKILCRECLQSTSTESSGHSRASQVDSRSGSDNVSSSSATFSSGSDSDSEDSRISNDTDYDAYCMAYTHKEFFTMWKNWEKKTETMDEVEDSRLIKKANNTMSPTDTDGQVKAQYGRVLPHAMKKMIKILELRREDVFLDIGHGIGNTCLHASFCTGCDSRGIEVVSDRHEIADKFRGGMYAEHHCRDKPRPEIGKVDLRLGRLEDPNQKDFLTKGITRAYVNNFNGVFAERSSKNKDKWFLDDYISGIFASLAPGAIMVTFHPLNLGLDRAGSNDLRRKHNLAESDHASYYDSEKILLGKAFCSVKWNKRSGNTNEIYVYKYKRLHQPGHHDAVFLCSNPSCKMATDMIPIPATTINEDGRCVINHCQCKFSPKNLRRRSNKQSSMSNKQTSP